VIRSPTRASVATAIVGLLLLGISAARGQDSSIGTAIKATYLYKFPPYIQWPPGAARTTGDFTLCVVGADPFGSLLDRAVSGQQIDGRPIALRRLAAFDAGAGCKLAFAAGSPAQVHDLLTATSGRPVLTGTEVEPDAREKGIINFVIAHNRIRFEIDDKAATQAGFTISSKLLSLALNSQPRN